MNAQAHSPGAPRTGSALEVLSTFLKLGISSFGGPIAHLGYFHRELVARRGWIDERGYAQLLALCQFLPGPASSQLGFSLGLIRAGWPGALAAFVGFTLPSALLLFAFAEWLPRLEQPAGAAAVHGLKLVAIAVIAQGVFSMAKRLAPDLPRGLIAIAAAAAAIAGNSAWIQLAVITAGALLGLALLSQAAPPCVAEITVPYGSRTGAWLLIAFSALLLAALTIAYVPRLPACAAVAAAFYRSGALVFGGGHVVLPLLKEAVVVPGWVSAQDFLAGYGAAQAVPGPLFSVAAFLGARVNGGLGGWPSATAALLAIFLPGLLLAAGALPFWGILSRNAKAARALAGVNASVVGLLAAALYSPLWTGTIRDQSDVAIALTGAALLILTRVSVLVVLAGCLIASIVRVLIAQ